jgi:hypothetical protein
MFWVWALALFLIGVVQGDRLDFVAPEIDATYTLDKGQALPVIFNVTRTDGTPFNLSTPVGFVLVDLVDASAEGHIVFAAHTLTVSTSFFISFDVGGTYSLSSWTLSQEDAAVAPGTSFSALSGDLVLLASVSPFHVVVLGEPSLSTSVIPGPVATTPPVFSGADRSQGVGLLVQAVGLAGVLVGW